MFGEVRSISEPLGLYRIHGSNDTSKPVEEYIKGFFSWFEHTCSKLSDHLNNTGVYIDPKFWPRDSWYHKIHMSLNEIEGLLPPEHSFILIDGNMLGIGKAIAGRPCIPFMEMNGKYYGEPVDDIAAIKEIERQRDNGIEYVIFAWTAFWYMDFYPALHNYLQSECINVLKNERLVIFHFKPVKKN